MGISMLLDMAADAMPDRIAVGRRADGIGYAELRRRALGVAATVRESGAGHVAFIGLNGPAFPALLFGAAAAGVPFTPLNYRLTAEQVGPLLAELDSPYVVADEAYLSLAGAGAVTTGALLERAAADTDGAEAAYVDDESAAVVLFTSGTTAKPKGVLLKHANLVSYVLETVEFAAAAEDDAVLVSVPPYHVAGVGSVLSNMYAGRRMVHLPNFDAAAWLELVRSEGVTNAMVVPTMLARVVDLLDGKPADTPTLRSLAYGGARMPHTVLEDALEAFPDTGFVNAYGLTETSSTIAVLGPEEHRGETARLGSVGRLVPGVEGVIRDGELWVRGPQISGEYVGLGSVLDADGWFPTRDRASFDDDGYLYIEGRSDDTIIRGGENIAPAEIEDVLITHPAVAEAAVVGVPDEEWGERIVAVLVPRRDQTVDPDDVRAFVRARLRGSRTPDDVVLRPELPYNPTGKLLRRDLVSELTRGTQ